MLVCFSAILSSCDNQGRRIEQAYEIVDADPDSAMALLRQCNRLRLSAKDEAAYALCYYMAQDKSGLDVADDSLIRIAYDYYYDKPNDALYAKSQYYMGKCLELNDSVDKSVYCLQNSIKAAWQTNDTATVCLASERLAKAWGGYKPIEALNTSKRSLELYSQYSKRKPANLIYYKLCLSECYFYIDSLNMAMRICREALSDSYNIGDSALISGVYQDMAGIFMCYETADSMLACAEKAVAFAKEPKENLLLLLYAAYFNAGLVDKAKKCLVSLSLDSLSPSLKMSVLYCFQKIAIVENAKVDVERYSDSIYNNVSCLVDELDFAKDKHYASVMSAEKERIMLNGETERRTYIIVFTFVLIFIFAMVAFLLQKSREKRMKLVIERDREIYEAKLLFERELRRKDAEASELLHKTQMEQKEKQLTIMKHYLLQKIDVASKIASQAQSNKKILLTDNDWDDIKILLDSVGDMFFSRIVKQFPQLTERDVRFLLLVRLGISTKDMALIYSIAEKSIKQKLYLYKAKVGIEDGAESLRDFISKY